MLTTPEEVMLLALARIDGYLTMIPTSFLSPTDLIRMTCVVGTEDGRVFLGGDDGCVHEMVYEDLSLDGDYFSGFTNGKSIESQLDQFYDGTKNIPDVVVDPSALPSVSEVFWKLGKRSLDSATMSSDLGPRKCRKLNRTTQASSVVTSLVPNVVRRVSSMVFGGPTSQNGGRLVQLKVDTQRRILYTLSEKGWVSVFDVGQPNTASCVAVCDVPRTARVYLEAVSRGQMFPPNSSSSTIGFIHFPGGGSGAQAGVGGMEGARDILKQADWQRNSSGRQNGQKRSDAHPMVTPVGLHVIPLEESARLTLMVVTGGGLRLYFSALSSSALSSGSISLTNGSRSRSFGNKLTLCHIRSPPPVLESNSVDPVAPSSWSADLLGGMVPRVLRTKTSGVDASFYREGQWVVALQGSTASTGCDTIVAVAPDTVARPRDSRHNGTTLEIAGGLNESVSFPIVNAQGQAAASRVLHGGLVWDIDSDHTENSPTMNLVLKSPTPSNAELEVGLPPIFYPPSQIRQRSTDADIRSKITNVAMVPSSSSLRSVVMNVIVNRFVGLPIDHGLNHGRSSSSNEDQSVYRLSKRTGINGFSLSAAENRRTQPQSSKASTKHTQSVSHTRAARLRRWLLQPPIQSLNQWTKQHLYKMNKCITAINVQGLHKFEFETVISSLSDALMDAGENVGNDSKVTSFFTSYGYKEGCAMCLALAIGCGPAQASVAQSQLLRRRASAAALARAYKPKLVREDQMNTVVSSYIFSNATDNCVPIGYVFRPSALSEGLFSLASRLLRPLWHKPLVVVTEGRSIKMRWGMKKTLTSSKVELLLDESSLEEIAGPCQALLSLMKTVFTRAIDVVPGTLGQQLFGIETDSQEQHYFTQALQYHSQFRSSTGDSATPLTPKECDNLAHVLEERNIHCIYRLVTLVVQLLDVLSLLRKAESTGGLPGADWGLLHGVTVADLVQTSEGHERLETLLNELVVATASEPSHTFLTSQTDRLAEDLAQGCYLFFPPASRFTYQGLRLANQALSHPPGSFQRKEMGEQASSRLIQAALYWHGASLISGRVVRGSEGETFRQIAERAVRYSSPLARAVDLLVKLGDVTSVVEICLTTSQNFKSLKMPVSSMDQTKYDGMLPWESDLYHKQQSTIERQTFVDKEIVTSSAVYGTSVAAKDAIETCYALVFVHLEELLQSDRPLAHQMVSACCAVTDKSFLASFFSYLLDNSHVDTLLAIDSPESESFLVEKNDPSLLWRHYSVLEKYIEAGRVAFDHARSNDMIQLGTRIEWLTRAVQSFRSAQSSGSAYSRTADQELTKYSAESEDCLRLAALQDQVVRRIDSLPEFPQDVDGSEFERLKTSLCEATPLYSFIARVPFFDLCLVMFHLCRYGDEDVIRTVWKNSFCEKILPCCSRDLHVFQFLEEFAGEVDLADRVIHLSETAETSDLPLFEDGTWVAPVHDMVVERGHQLYGNGADFTFPVIFILEQLEVLREHHPNLSFGWPLITLCEAGVPYLAILACYEKLGGADGSRTLVRASALVELFQVWVSASRSAGQRAGQHSAAHVELSRAMSTGDLMPKLNSLRLDVEQIQGTDYLIKAIEDVEESISLLVSI